MAKQRLIDANALERNVWLDGACLAIAVSEVDNAPTVDATPMVHGRWEWYIDRHEDLFLGCDEDYGWRCSYCKTPLEDCDDHEVQPNFNYCPSCGAKMDLEEG